MLLRVSMDSISVSKMVRRTDTLPSINGPTGQFEDEDNQDRRDSRSSPQSLINLRDENKVLKEWMVDLRLSNLKVEENFVDVS